MSNDQPRRPWTAYLINLSMLEEESIDETMSLIDAAKLVGRNYATYSWTETRKLFIVAGLSGEFEGFAVSFPIIKRQ